MVSIEIIDVYKRQVPVNTIAKINEQCEKINLLLGILNAGQDASALCPIAKEAALTMLDILSQTPDVYKRQAQYDGLYAVCTDLLDDDVNDILKLSEGRWQMEECFRIMKTDFSARPVYLQDENRIKAHFLICFLSLTIYRYLRKS